MATFTRRHTVAFLASAVVHLAAATCFVWPAGRLPADIIPPTAASEPGPVAFPTVSRALAAPHVEEEVTWPMGAGMTAGLVTHVWQSTLFALAVGAMTLAFRR